MEELYTSLEHTATIHDWYGVLAGRAALILDEVMQQTGGFEHSEDPNTLGEVVDTTIEMGNFIVGRVEEPSTAYISLSSGQIDIYNKERIYYMAKTEDGSPQKLLKLTRKHHHGDPNIDPEIMGVRAYSLRLPFGNKWPTEWGFAAVQHQDIINNVRVDPPWIELSSPEVVSSNTGKVSRVFGPSLLPGLVDTFFDPKGDKRRQHIGESITYHLHLVRTLVMNPDVALNQAVHDRLKWSA